MPHHTYSERDHVRLRDANLYCEFRDRSKVGDQEGAATIRDQLSSKHAGKCTALLNKSKHALLAQHLDKVLAIKAMRSSFLLKVMHKVLAVRCPEVIIFSCGSIGLVLTITVGSYIVPDVHH